MSGFSFIHAGDLHLDSPFKGVTSRSLTTADSLRSATFEAFDALVQLCIEKQVRFLLVAGDVYDGADRSLRAQLKFLDGLKRLADHQISSFVAHGNHDPMDGWSSMIAWPGEVHVFGANQVETRTIIVNGEPVACVSGISHSKRNEGRNLALKFRAANPNLFQIGVLHCNCGGNQNHEAYSPCSLDDLRGIDFDYWALGHVHQKKILHADPYVVYPGNTQGLSIREVGERGCYLVTVSEDCQVDMEFYPLDAVRWLSAEISIDVLDSMNSLDRAIAKTIDELKEDAGGRPVLCRISLTGRGPLYRELRREATGSALLERSREIGLSEEPFVWVQDIEVNCQPEVDLVKRRDSNDLIGQMLRVAREIHESIPQDVSDYEHLQDILTAALGELYENRRAGKFLELPSPDELKRILREAELLCVDLLETAE